MRMSIIALLPVLLLSAAAEEPPARIKFEVKYASNPMDMKTYRALNPEETKNFEKELKAIPGVEGVTSANSVFTVTVASGKTVTLMELRMAGKRVQEATPGATYKIMYNSIKLDGKVTLFLTVPKNQDKVKDALKSVSGISDVQEADGGYECKAKNVDLVGALKTVCTKTENGNQYLQVLKDVKWHGAPAPPPKKP